MVQKYYFYIFFHNFSHLPFFYLSFPLPSRPVFFYRCDEYENSTEHNTDTKKSMFYIVDFIKIRFQRIYE